MPQGSHEGTVIRGFIELCLELPWNRRTRSFVDIKRAEKICDDNYYEFYLRQVQCLYSVIHNTSFPKDMVTDSVFFVNKKSFFEQRQLALLQAQKKNLTDIKQLNCFLKKELFAFNHDYDYFKNADMFSLIERWYE